MKYYRVQLVRSLIGMNKTTKKIAESLGLDRISSYSYVEVSPSSAGKILKLRPLVDVKLYAFENKLELKKKIISEKLERKAKDGFRIINDN